MRIKLVDAENRLAIKFVKTEGIWSWGDDNNYPSLVKSIIGSSVTAKAAAEVNWTNLYGKGFEFVTQISDKNSLIVNKYGRTINELLNMVSIEFSQQNNIFLHVNYNGDYETISCDLLRCTDMRIGKSDSTGYSGKFVKYDNFDKSKSKSVKPADYIYFDRFNPTPEVIEAQVIAAGGWQSYKGQVLHLNSNFSEFYSLSDVDTVMHEAYTEHLIQRKRNEGYRKGFHGSKLVITKPFADDDERDAFEETLTGLREDSSGILLLESKLETDNLADNILIQNMENNVGTETKDDELAIKHNILQAFGVAPILIGLNSDNSIFGNSGELLIQAKLMHWEKLESKRNLIVGAFEKIFSRFHKPINPTNNWAITPIVQKAEPVTNE